MYKYYMSRNFNPTYSALESEDRLDRYMQERCHMLQDRLYLPLWIFDKRKVLEFGPAGGENALLWAIWGAEVYLVEPVEAFHNTIRNYFDLHGQKERLKLVAKSTLSEFDCEDEFDFVVAEGFVHTTGAAHQWTKLLARFCKKRGFVIINMPELAGYLVELLQAKLCQICCARYNIDEIETAKIILGQKWERTSHSKSFEAWAKDVLYNPYQDYKWLNHSGDILKLMYELGFDLYSSYPSFRPDMDVRWIRQLESRKQKLEEGRAVALRLVPSLMLGQTVILKNSFGNESCENILSALGQELKALSALDTEVTKLQVAELLERHSKTRRILDEMVLDHKKSLLAKLMAEIENCLHLIGERPEQLAKLFGRDTVMGNIWGSPNQYLVFQRR